MKKIYLLLLLISGSISSLIAQTAEIRGFVYEKESSEPAIYTSVFLKGTTYGAQTNLDGFYIISRVPAGHYRLMVTSVGFDTLSMELDLKSGDLITKKLYLTKSAIQIREVEISAESEANKSDVQIGVSKITPKDIRQVPTIGGEPDLAQYLQVVPGVIFSGDQGGQLYIRGGTAVQNKLLLDGMVIYNPFHSIGLYSVLDADIIRGADVYTAGFNAEYGGRISSIMDITTRDGNKKRVAGKVSANTFTSKVLLEGPLKVAKDETDGSSSFLVTCRTSYLDKTSKSLYKYADSLGLPFSFTDLYGKISINSPSGSKVNFFGFNFKDNVNYNHVADLGWTSTGAGSNFILVPTGSSVLIEGNFAYSNYSINLKESDNRERFSKISGFNTGLTFNSFIGKDELRYGFEVLGFKTNYQFASAIGANSAQDENTTEIAGFMKYKWVKNKFVFEPGIHIHYYASLGESPVEPRLGFKYNISDKVRFKGAAGLYSQNFLSAASDRDVVNLFYGFLTGSDNLPKTFKGEELTSRLQKARHLVAGFEIDLPLNLTTNIEAYIKDFTQLENINRNKIYEDNSQNANKPDSLVKDFIIETGVAKGIDFTLKYDRKNFYLWFVYSLTYVNRDNGNQVYSPSFDRRHNINIVGSYKFGRKKEWLVSARWNLGSPFPFTQSQSYYEVLQLPNGIGSNVNSNNGNVGVYYADLNKGRLSYFHRLDISIQKVFHFGKNSSLEVTAGASNVYDRQNIFYVSRLTGDRVYQLPIIPTLGVNFIF